MKKLTGDSVLLVFLMFLICLVAVLHLFAGCGEPSKANNVKTVFAEDKLAPAVIKPIIVEDAAGIIGKKEVPILCYHQIRDWKPTDSKRAKDYIVPIENFRLQMKMLADKGFNTISPDQLYDYLSSGASLPANPIMLTFDDTDEDQFTVARTEMNKYGFKGVYFIMTVSLNKPGYMSTEQVKQLSNEGHTIASHSWDHKNVKKYEEKDWSIQIEKPIAQLQAITGKPIRYFAYPFGLWNNAAIPGLKQRGIRAAFQLSTDRDQKDPLYTIRRIIVPGSWSLKSLENSISSSFR